MKSIINKQYNFLAGFTLIESLAIISIILLLSGIAITNRLSGQKKYDVLQVSKKFASDLRQAQNMAISGKKQGTVASAGYGLYVVSPEQYKIFYNKTIDASDSSKRYDEVMGNSVDIETIRLPLNVSLSLTGITIFFVSPDPTTYINGLNFGLQDFILASDGINRKITVYSSGLINAD